MARKDTIEDLFREQLGGAEIQPSEGSWKRVQQMYRRKNFFRFQSRSLNVYYLGAAALLAAALVIFVPQDELESGSGQAQSTEEVFPQDETPNTIAQRQEAVRRTDSPDSGQEAPVKEATEPGGQTPESEISTLQKVRVEAPEPDPQKDISSGPAIGEKAAPEQQPLRAFFQVSAEEGCAPVRIEFRNESIGADRYEWYFGDGISSQAMAPGHDYKDAGNYTVTLHAYNAQGEKAIFRDMIEVHPCPDASFQVLEGISTANGLRGLQLMNYSSGGLDYKWQMLDSEDRVLDGWVSKDFQPELIGGELPAGAQSVRLEVTSFHGCCDTSKLELPASATGLVRELRFANAFEASHTGPSGGYYNAGDKDTHIFHPVFPEEPATYQLQVFSRTGERVFESQEILRGWDGYIRQTRAPAGVYLWICEGSWNDGESFSYKGDLTLFWSDGQWP